MHVMLAVEISGRVYCPAVRWEYRRGGRFQGHRRVQDEGRVR